MPPQARNPASSITPPYGRASGERRGVRSTGPCLYPSRFIVVPQPLSKMVAANTQIARPAAIAMTILLGTEVVAPYRTGQVGQCGFGEPENEKASVTFATEAFINSRR